MIELIELSQQEFFLMTLAQYRGQMCIHCQQPITDAELLHGEVVCAGWTPERSIKLAHNTCWDTRKIKEPRTLDESREG